MNNLYYFSSLLSLYATYYLQPLTSVFNVRSTCVLEKHSDTSEDIRHSLLPAYIKQTHLTTYSYITLHHVHHVRPCSSIYKRDSKLKCYTEWLKNCQSSTTVGQKINSVLLTTILPMLAVFSLVFFAIRLSSKCAQNLALEDVVKC